MQIDNTKLLEALKHPGRPDAEKAEVSKELKDKAQTKEIKRFRIVGEKRKKRQLVKNLACKS